MASKPTRTPPIDPDKIVQRRLQLGLTQKGLADLAGISKQLMNDIEAGRRDGSPPTRLALTKALRLRRVSALYRDEDAA